MCFRHRNSAERRKGRKDSRCITAVLLYIFYPSFFAEAWVFTLIQFRGVLYEKEMDYRFYDGTLFDDLFGMFVAL